MSRIVWVLGAGFSKPLGGPLLAEMLTSVGASRVAAAFPQSSYGILYGEPADSIRNVYARYGPTSEKAPGYKKHWDNAEEYLEFLDAAAYAEENRGERAPLVQLRNSLFGARPPSSAEVAKRLMAAECCTFYKDADPESEKWQPYRRWVRELGEGDSVITFNYDCVVEEVAKAAGVQNALTVAMPGQPLPAKSIPLLKLHGSVDWRLSGGQVMQSGHPHYALVGREGEIVIASPGPTKRDVVTKHLDPLWQLASGCLREASAIAFLGYRFPPTDSTAREKLLGAIGQNAHNPLAVHVVLGPRAKSDDVLRLEGMLGHVLAGRVDGKHTVTAHPMGAEDFMALFVPGQLLPHG